MVQGPDVLYLMSHDLVCFYSEQQRYLLIIHEFNIIESADHVFLMISFVKSHTGDTGECVYIS